MKKIFAAAFLVVMMCAATAFAAWGQIYTDQNDNQIYADPDNVQVTMKSGDKAEFNAKYRMVYTERGRKTLIDWYRDYSIVPAGIENLDNDLTTIKFKRDGNKRYYAIVERIYYTAGGSAIEGMHFYEPNAEWKEIPVGSVIDVEYYDAVLIVDGKKYDANY